MHIRVTKRKFLTNNKTIRSNLWVQIKPVVKFWLLFDVFIGLKPCLDCQTKPGFCHILIVSRLLFVFSGQRKNPWNSLLANAIETTFGGGFKGDCFTAWPLKWDVKVSFASLATWQTTTVPNPEWRKCWDSRRAPKIHDSAKEFWRIWRAWWRTSIFPTRHQLRSYIVTDAYVVTTARLVISGHKNPISSLTKSSEDSRVKRSDLKDKSDVPAVWTQPKRFSFKLQEAGQ